MGLLDNILNEALPNGNVAKPALLALGALMVDKMLSPSAPTDPQPAVPDGTSAPASGNLLNGVAGILEKLQSSGHGDTVNSWLGAGQNTPIQPNHLGTALGSDILQSLSQQTGLNEQDLLNQISQALPGLVDKLTPDGRLPTLQEAEALLRR